MAKKPRKKRPPWKEPCEYIDSLDPKACPPHGAPTVKGPPVLCLKCNEAISGAHHRCFWHVKRRTFERMLLDQQAEDAAKPFAERNARKRKAKVAEAKPMREWKFDHPRAKENVKARTKSEARARFKGMLKGPIPKGSIIEEVTS